MSEGAAGSSQKAEQLTGHKAPSTSGANAPQGPPVVSPDGRKKAYKIRGASFTVDARYDVIKAIGLGAYGMVCSAKDTNTGKYVAIKRIPKLFNDLVDCRRVLREIKCLRLLAGKHGNLLQLLDVLSPIDPTPEGKKAFGDVYLVSDLFDTDLLSVLRSKHKITFEHHTYISYQLFKGLAHIHYAGILHRDLKPGNLFVGSQCHITIGDFGLARGGIPLRTDLKDDLADPDVGNDTPKHVQIELTDYVITRWYRAPELLLMVNYDHAVDMWSVGCILAEMMLRRPLFQGQNYLQQFQIIGELVDFPSDPAEVAKILPTASSEQCRTAARIGAALQARDEKELGAEKAATMTTRERLFRRFGLDPEGCSRTWNRFMDLAAALLHFDPQQRLTARGAAQHPYVGHLLKTDPEKDTLTGSDEVFSKHVHSTLATTDLQAYWGFDYEELSEDLLRDQFWQAMNTHQGDFANAKPAASTQ